MPQTPPLTYSDRGIALTKRFEGVRLRAYRDCAGVLTIGYGHTGKDVTEGMTVTPDQALALLVHDVSGAVACVNHQANLRLTQGQFDALVDFTFNCGAAAFVTSTLLRKLNAGDLRGAAAEFLVWDHAGGRVVEGLEERRQGESELFLSAAADTRTRERREAELEMFLEPA